MTVVFTNHKVAFIHISKCAGTSVKEWAKPISGLKHLSKHAKFDNPQHRIKGQDYKVFSIVRHPADRAVSLFHFCGQLGLGSIKLHPRSRPKVYDRWLTYYEQGFETFLMAIRDRDPNVDCWPADPDWHMWDSQCSWLGGCESPIVLRYENLNNDFSKMQQALGDYRPLPLTNSSEHDDYRQYITQDTKKLIEDIWREDFERLNYH